MSTIPNDPVQALLAQVSLKTTLFLATSRYYGLDTETLVQNGRPVAYVTRRFLPQVSGFQVLQTHTVIQGERLDNITARYLGDPTLFWRICDANNAMNPDAMTATIGRTLNITMPSGITGSSL
ncbi:MAG TPA: hypothetical protein VGH23_02025 [Rhizomicrobium sp.]|jgi:hypothetical protein|nr:hypothetical protein [Acetobacteraceae bacterium]